MQYYFKALFNDKNTSNSLLWEGFDYEILRANVLSYLVNASEQTIVKIVNKNNNDEVIEVIRNPF